MNVKLLCLTALLLAAGPNVWSQQMKVSDYGTNSIVFTNQWVAFTNSGRVHAISVYNSSGADAWLHVLDTNQVAAAGTAAQISPVKIPAGSTGGHDWNLYTTRFSRGCVLHASTTDRTVTNSTASFQMTVIFSR